MSISLSIITIMEMAAIVAEGVSKIVKHYNEFRTLPEFIDLDQNRITEDTQAFVDRIRSAQAGKTLFDSPKPPDLETSDPPALEPDESNLEEEPKSSEIEPDE